MILMITLLIICYNNNNIKIIRIRDFQKGLFKEPQRDPRRVKKITNIKANDRVSFKNKQ